MKENEISRKVIGAAIDVHRELGPGLLVDVYRHCLVYELEHRGMEVKNEVSMPLVYKGEKLDSGCCHDLLVEDKVVVELRSAKSLEKKDFAEILSHLKLAELKLGLIINFNAPLLKKGIQRVVNNL